MHNQTIGLLSVYMDLGAGRRGVDMGPSAIRIAGLVPRLQHLGYTIQELGTVHAGEPEDVHMGATRARYLDEVADVCWQVHQRVRNALTTGFFPLILGGDHSLSIGSVSGIANHYRQEGKRIGLIWVDAHADMNTPQTSPSGNIHGMPISVLLGNGEPRLTALNGAEASLLPEHVCIIGARDIDALEKDLVKQSGVRVFTMSEIDERGIGACVEEAIDRVSQGTAGFHLSFDLDAIDPWEAPGVGTPVSGGLTYREAHLVCEKAAQSRRMIATEFVEVNPILDNRNHTAELAVSLIESAFGKRIL
ncbi:MAG: arginase [Calditrichaeota bacterium]|nr:arginase [Calditrichota bacterium]